MAPRALLLAIACLALPGSAALAEEHETRWGVTIWGVSRHIDRSIEYEENNWGGGLRYYVARHLFVEGDLLRNSNDGLVVPASAGAELPMFGLGRSCDVSAVAALAIAYYQNRRTNNDYVKWGPVPGVAFRCGHVQPNIVAVLSPTSKLLTALAASVTIHF